MATEIKIPSMGESISEVQIGEWLKKKGDTVNKDEDVVTVESEKASLEIPAPAAGRLSEIVLETGETAKVGDVIARIEEGEEDPEDKGGKKQEEDKDQKKKKDKKEDDEQQKENGKPERKGKDSGDKPDKKQKESKPEKKSEKKSGKQKQDKEDQEDKEDKEDQEGEKPRVMPAARRLLDEHDLKAEEVEASGPGGRLLKEDVLRHLDREEAEPEEEAEPAEEEEQVEAAEDEEVVPMSMLRRTIAKRLVDAQQTMAILTTFNEVDLSAVMQLRKDHQEAFKEKYDIKLGFMSFFVKAAIDALKQIPQLNAEIRGDNIVYRNRYDIGVAIGTEKGLLVPVLSNAERLSFAETEKAIVDFAERARNRKLAPEELQGGTFTITNGGVYGSLLSTPIINPPQSGILGLHTIQDRPVAIDGQVVIRPMMYTALSYDHRIVDGKEAVTFLKRIKETIENPARLLLEV